MNAGVWCIWIGNGIVLCFYNNYLFLLLLKKTHKLANTDTDIRHDRERGENPWYLENFTRDDIKVVAVTRACFFRHAQKLCHHSDLMVNCFPFDHTFYSLMWLDWQSSSAFTKPDHYTPARANSCRQRFWLAERWRCRHQWHGLLSGGRGFLSAELFRRTTWVKEPGGTVTFSWRWNVETNWGLKKSVHGR